MAARARPATTAVVSENSDRFVDLDALLTARAEAAGDPVVIRFGGRRHELPAELPLKAAIMADRNDMEGLLRALLPNSVADAFINTAPVGAADDFAAGIRAAYGIDEGE